jgi:hypothetical protein
MAGRGRNGRKFRRPVPARKPALASSDRRPENRQSAESPVSPDPDSIEDAVAGRSGAVPELVTRINEGEFDDDLYLLMRVIRARWEAVEAAKTLHALASLQIGDRVRINQEVKSKRLQGLVGAVVARDDDAIIVCLGPHDTGVGHRHVRCSPLVVDRLPKPPE